MNLILKVSIGISVLIVLYTYFYWSIIDIVTPFLILFISGPIYLLFGGTFVASIVYLIKKWSSQRFIAVYPFAFCVGTIFILFILPFVSIKINIDFFLNKADMEHVVSMVKTGELQPNTEHSKSLVSLPLEYSYLSKGGGEINFNGEAEEFYVFFYTFRGILDNFSGYVYSEKGVNYENMLGCQSIDEISLSDNWYWVSCS